MTGIERINHAFQLRRTAFMPYAVLGYPTPEASLQVIETLVAAGADLLELGVPFSDPLADGPTIQAATQRALENGVTLSQCLTMVAELRKHEPLLNQLDFPGTVLLHLNPHNEACPITVHIDYKLPSSTN